MQHFSLRAHARSRILPGETGAGDPFLLRGWNGILLEAEARWSYYETRLRSTGRRFECRLWFAKAGCTTGTCDKMNRGRGSLGQGHWAEYLARYRDGEWRTPILHDMILEDVQCRGNRPTFLDIGCGSGFDGKPELQEKLASRAGRYIGIEPDIEVQVAPFIHEAHRCTFEEAPIEPCSVDIAVAVMVLEHVADPQSFFGKLHEVLVDGGVFWALATDARHYFCPASRCASRLGIKDRYLTCIQGDSGVHRYRNYPTYYRANTPRQILRYARDFSSADFIGFTRVGQLDFYYPCLLRPLGRLIDSLTIVMRLPGPTLAIRLVK